MEFCNEQDQTRVILPKRCEGRFGKELFDRINELDNIQKLVLDFLDVLFIDSSTIGVLVKIDRDFKTSKTPFVLKNLSEDITELFTDTGLDMLFTIETNNGVEEASIDIFETSVDIRLDVNTEIKDDVCIFHLKGVMNHPMGSRFFKQQFLLTLADHKKILLDFENLTFFDSLSVSVVLSMNKLLRETGGSLRFCNPNYIIEDLFQALNLTKIISTFDNIADALVDWE